MTDAERNLLLTVGRLLLAHLNETVATQRIGVNFDIEDVEDDAIDLANALAPFGSDGREAVNEDNG